MNQRVTRAPAASRLLYSFHSGAANKSENEPRRRIFQGDSSPKWFSILVVDRRRGRSRSGEHGARNSESEGDGRERERECVWLIDENSPLEQSTLERRSAGMTETGLENGLRGRAGNCNSHQGWPILRQVMFQVRKDVVSHAVTYVRPKLAVVSRFYRAT